MNTAIRTDEQVASTILSRETRMSVAVTKQDGKWFFEAHAGCFRCLSGPFLSLENSTFEAAKVEILEKAAETRAVLSPPDRGDVLIERLVDCVEEFTRHQTQGYPPEFERHVITEISRQASVLIAKLEAEELDTYDAAEWSEK